ncbi:MAG: ATP-binding protein [Chloroflexota bacterium]|nr:ATP-binding protein [Chloroflexota bacterium]
MIIAVASGKGGTGKTLVSTSLALSIEENVHLLDCDVEEPNAHIFLKPDLDRSEAVSIPVPQVDEAKCTFCGKCAEVCAFNAIAVVSKSVLVFPELCHGCGSCSYFCPEDAISEVGKEIGVVETGRAGSIDFAHGKLNIGEAMAPPLIRAVKEKIDPLKTVIIDVPPGTSCPVVESIEKSDFCLLVTEPTPFGLNDLILAIEVIRKLDIPHGVVINRAGFGDNKTEEYCKQESIPILMHIPLDTEIARKYSSGVALVQGMPEWRPKFQQLYNDIVNQTRIKT